MLKPLYPYYIANEPRTPNDDLPVTDKYTGEIACRVALADAKAIDEAITAAVQAAPALAAMAACDRQAVLEHCVNRFRQRMDELAYSLCVEGGKPIKDARGEVARLIDTFKTAAEAAVDITGEVIPMDRSARARNYRGMWKRVPIGPCSFISPFNFPLNLAAHKVAPALAVGCPFVLKPASLTPIGALIIGEVLAETDLPKGAFSILPCRRDGADLFTTDERLKLLSFTGSPEVGWNLKARAGKKKVVLELGGNAAVVIDETWENLNDAVERCVIGAFYQSGQSCISVQRILVHESIYEAFREKFIAAVSTLKHGDPKEEDTFIGPVISDAEADRMERWIRSAVAAGARILCGGSRQGRMVQATVLENVPVTEPAYAEEFFGPMALLKPFTSFEEALAEVNNSRFGLQAGVFTQNIYRANRAWDTLEVGGVVIGDVPSWRVDHMPYGGVKESGIGREGIRYAIEDMTELRLMVLRVPPHA